MYQDYKTKHKNAFSVSVAGTYTFTPGESFNVQNTPQPFENHLSILPLVNSFNTSGWTGVGIGVYSDNPTYRNMILSTNLSIHGYGKMFIYRPFIIDVSSGLPHSLGDNLPINITSNRHIPNFTTSSVSPFKSDAVGHISASAESAFKVDVSPTPTKTHFFYAGFTFNNSVAIDFQGHIALSIRLDQKQDQFFQPLK